MEIILEDAQSNLNMLVREQHFKEMKKCRAMGAELKRMFIDGRASLEKVEAKKKVFLSGLQKMRKAAEVTNICRAKIV